MMIKAGDPVDQMLERIAPLLEEGDILIDGGNSFFKDTQRREAAMRARGLNFFGMGVSGGEEGARHGPSLMPGGDPDAYRHVQKTLESIAAKTPSGACVTYVGADGAGHFVKMVHNGIEYGDMQLIAEAYDLLRHSLGLAAQEIAEVFAQWNRGPLASYLIEISAEILTAIDPETRKPLVDLVLDKAGQKGTGKWTAQIALDLGVPVPTISAALDARALSSMKDQRMLASAQYKRTPLRATGDRAELDRRHRRRALCQQNLLLCPRHESDRGRCARVELEDQPARDGAHLEGRLHHSRASSGCDHAGLRAPTGAGEPAARLRDSVAHIRLRFRPGARSSAWLPRWEFPHRPFLHRWPTLTPTPPPNFRRISPRLSATSLARIPINARTGPRLALSTPTGAR